MLTSVEFPFLKLYLTLDETISDLLEQQGLTYASARQLSKLMIGMLTGLKKSISSMHRLYFPEYSVQSVLKHLKKLIKNFRSYNKAIFERICKCWDKRRRVFVICDDFLLPRYTKKAYRSGVFRDPVKKKVGIGHNIVDTIITTGGLEFTFDYALQPKNSKITKTKRALTQLKTAIIELRKRHTPKARIRLVMDGGYTNMTVLPDLKKMGLKYIGTIRRNKIIKLFGEKYQIQGILKDFPEKFLSITGNKYFYEVRTYNLRDYGRHQVFAVRRPGENEVTYYLTNDLKMTPLTFLCCLHERYWIEQGHRDLKQHCGLKQLFVRKKDSVEGIISLGFLLKNILTMLVAESGLTLREYPIESIVEKEFHQFEQDLLKTLKNSGLLEESNM